MHRLLHHYFAQPTHLHVPKKTDCMNTTSGKPSLSLSLAGPVAALLFLAAILAPRAIAADVYWGGGTGAITLNNWYSDAALTTLTTRANADAMNLASGTLFITSSVASGRTGLGLAAGDNAAIMVSNTWRLTDSIVIGNVAGSSGEVRVLTGGVMNAATISIGGTVNTTGTLSILTGGTVNATTFYVGQYGTGYLHVAEGAALTNTANAMFGRYTGGSGTAVIDGSWTAGTYIYMGYIADSRDNTLIIGQTGTVAAATHVRIANAVGSSGTIITRGLLDMGDNLSVGFAGEGTLLVESGGTTTVRGLAYIGYEATGSGTATISGVLTVSNTVLLGNLGKGYLNVTETGTAIIAGNVVVGGAAESSGSISVGGYLSTGYLYMNAGTTSLNVKSTGTMELNGAVRMGNIAGSVASGTVAGLLKANASDFNVGYTGAGSLVITESGTVILRNGVNNDYLVLGRAAGGYGQVTVRGLLDTGTRNNATNANIYIAHTGSGVMNVESTGTVIGTGTGGDTMVLMIANNANTAGTLNLAGTFLVNKGRMMVGYGGNGYLNVLSGGSMLVEGSAGIGNSANSKGAATIAGLWQVGTNLTIGNSGTGVLDVQSGGSVIVGGTTIIGGTTAGTGTLALNGGVLETRQLARGEGAAAFVFNGGTLRASAATADFLNMAVLNLGAGALNLDTQAFAVTATNAFAGSSGAVLNKLGAGALTLTADSSAYAGTTNIRAGSLVGNAAAKIGGQLNILNGATLDLRNGPLAAANVTFADGATWFYSLTGKNELGATGALAFGGGGTLLLDRGILEYGDIPGAYTLATYATITGTGNLASWFVTGVDFATQSTFNTTSTPGSLILEIGYAGLDFLYWQGGAGTWDAATASWIRSGTAALWNSGALGIFNAGAGAVDVSGVQTFSGLQFDSDGYVLGGTGTLAAGGTANINVTTAGVAATINTALAADALRKAGPGAVTLGGVATIGGLVAVDSGSLAVAPAGVLSASEIQVSSTVSTPATLAVAGVLNNTGTLFVGSTGSGALIVESGGTATSTREIQIGSHGSGTARVAGYLGTSGTAYIGVDAGGQGVLDIASTGTVKVGNSGYIGNLAGATGTAFVAGLLDVTTNLGVGQSGIGVLDVASTGTVKVANTAYVGNLAGSSGTAFVAGLLDITTNLAVGQGGAGVLDIASTGAVRVGGGSYIANQAGSSGTLVVAGTLGTSTLSIGAALGTEAALRILTGGTVSADTFYVGNYGTGYLYIAEGASLTNTANAMLGRNTGGSGTAVIDGSWTAGTYIQMGYIADSLNNVVIIGQTGTVKNASYFRVGAAAGSSGTLTVRGLLDVGTNLSVGLTGSGALYLESSGSIIAGGTTYVGFDAGSSGTAMIGGYLLANSLNVGQSGTGVLDLVSGGTIIANSTVIGSAATANGTLVLDGGVLETRQIAAGAGGATLVFNGGTIRAAASGTDFFSNIPTLDLGGSALSFDTQAFSVTATNAFAGSSGAALAKLGTGSLVLANDSAAFAGTLAVQGGSLILGPKPGSTDGVRLGGLITVGGGAIIRPMATGTVNNLSLAAGSTLDLRSAALAASGNVTLSDGAVWQYSLGGAHVLDVSGTLILAGGGSFLIDRGGISIPDIPGVYTLANYTDITGAANLGLWTVAGMDFTLSSTLTASLAPGSITLAIGSADVDFLYWQTGDGVWDAASTTWVRSGSPVAWNSGAVGVFNAGSGTVNVSGLQSISGLQFDTAGYILNGTGTLTSGGTANINVTTPSASATINVALTAVEMHKAGPGSLTLGGPASFTGAAVIDKGALTIAPAGVLSAAGVQVSATSGDAAALTVAGTLASTGTLFIGKDGSGVLAVESGGRVNQGAETIVGNAGAGSGLLQVKTGGVYNQTASYLRIGGGAAGEVATSGTLIIENGGTATASSHIHVGSYGSGTARVNGYLGTNGNIYIGVYDGSRGVATIGSTGTLNVTGGISIGYDAGASGTLAVEGLAKAGGNLYLGQNANATGSVLAIAPTGTVQVTGIGYIANAAGSSGTANVAGLLNITGNLAVGMNGAGSLNIAQGGVVNSDTTALGWQASSTGIADVAGFWNIAANLNLGNAAGSTGLLSIASTGTVKTATFVNLGNGANSSGTATVAGLLSATGSLAVGSTGAGTLDIAATGRVTAGAASYIGNAAGSNGRANVAGLLAVTGSFAVGYNGAGSLDIAPTGTVSNAGTSYIGSVAGGSGTATVAGFFGITGNLAVGQSGVGSLAITPTGTITVAGNTYVANQAGSSGTLTVAGFFDRAGNLTIANANASAGYVAIAATGTVMSGNVILGSGTGAQGFASVSGVWLVSGSANEVGSYGTGTLVIEQTGTMIIRGGGNNDFLLSARYAGSAGGIIVRGFLDTGTRNSASNANLYVGYQGTDTMTIEATGTVITSGTALDIRALSVGHSGSSLGTLNLAGYFAARNGSVIIANSGTGILNIASTGSMTVDGEYKQGVRGTLGIELDSARTTPYITAGSAVLSGSLNLTGAGLNYAPVAKSSELSDAGVLILTATSGAIHGGFTSITGMGGSAPDYLLPGGFIETDADTGYATYRAAYRLAWNAPSSAHGTFTLAEGQTFEVDTPLGDRLGEAAPGWDKKSLTKEGAGTLVLSAQNTFTGTLAINSGTIRLGGPATHTFGSLANNGALDFGSPATVPVTPPGILAAPPSGMTYRTVKVGSLSGNGALHMTVNPGTGESDRLIVLGNATGAHHINLTASPDATAPHGGPAPALATISGSNTATFTGGLDYAGTNYAIVPASGGNIILATNGEAGINDAIRGVPGAQSLMWFASQDNLARRLGELRGAGKAPSGEFALWARARAEQARLSSGTDMRAFKMELYGFELGADKTLPLTSARLVIGAYAGYGRATQDFRPREGTGTADGESIQTGLGLYAAWLHDNGWFANLTLAAVRYKNELNSADQSGNTTTGDHRDDALGASLELGKRIALDRAIGKGWFAEPVAQASIARLERGDYRTTGANILEVTGKDIAITRLRASVKAGRLWAISQGVMELSGRLGASHEESSGGEIQAGSRWRPNVDGTRAEAGLGLIWRPTTAGQLYFDYEFATGDCYQKPWSVSLGYRHAF